MYRSLSLLFLVLVSCNSKPDLKAEEQIIRNMLATERKAHFERNADLFVSEFSDSMLSINRGKVKLTPPDTMRKSISKYFNSVSFVKWDDLAKPIIRFSEDGKMAYAVVQKQVIVSRPDSLGNPVLDSTQYAWVSVYRKVKGAWKVEANVSTNK